MKKTIVTLCTVLVVVILVFGGLFALWYKGGSELSSHVVDINTGKPSPLISPRLFYRGIKISDEYDVALFKRYYMIAEIDHYSGMSTGVSYKKDGYNQFFMFYESGQIAAHGFCMVETQEWDGQILHDIGNVKEAQYYATDGTLVSTVKDGTGVITLHFSDGSKQWQLELENYQ